MPNPLAPRPPQRTVSVSTLLSFLAAVLPSACALLPEEPAQAPAQPAPELAPDPAASFAAPEVSPAPAVSESPPEQPPVENVILPGVQPTGGQTRGVLPKAAVSTGVATGTEAFESCYQKVAPGHPGLKGTITVNFVVTPEGDVPHATALDQGTDIANEQLIECVLAVFKTLHFPPPHGGRAVITYPLRFEPSL